MGDVRLLDATVGEVVEHLVQRHDRDGMDAALVTKLRGLLRRLPDEVFDELPADVADRVDELRSADVIELRSSQSA